MFHAICHKAAYYTGKKRFYHGGNGGVRENEEAQEEENVAAFVTQGNTLREKCRNAIPGGGLEEGLLMFP
jgi:hypothetical protein